MIMMTYLEDIFQLQWTLYSDHWATYSLFSSWKNATGPHDFASVADDVLNNTAYNQLSDANYVTKPSVTKDMISHASVVQWSYQ